jgi:hypothetical protein
MDWFIPDALIHEFYLNREYLGLKEAVVDKNYSYYNQPQLTTPAIYIDLVNGKNIKTISGGQFYSTSGSLHICIMFSNDMTTSQWSGEYSQDLENSRIKEMTLLYQIPNRIEHILARENWIGQKMKDLYANNSLTLTSRGFNRSKEYIKENVNLITYDMNVGFEYIPSDLEPECREIMGYNLALTFKTSLDFA